MENIKILLKEYNNKLKNFDIDDDFAEIMDLIITRGDIAVIVDELEKTDLTNLLKLEKKFLKVSDDIFKKYPSIKESTIQDSGKLHHYLLPIAV